MTLKDNVAEGYDIRQHAVEAVRPAWSDAALDQFERMETDEPDAVRFAGKINGVEFHQWADDEGGHFVLSDGPYVTTHTIPDLDELPMTEVSDLGVTLVRISQFIALANETAIEVGMLRLSDINLIAKRQDTTTTALLLAVGRRGDAAPEEVAS